MAADHTLTAAGLTGRDVESVLRAGSLTLIGRLAAASNASFLAQVDLDGVTLPCIYKPVAGERPLWDFPDGTLAARELAARLVSEAGGWGLVPPTVVRDGRFGPGMCQQWIDVDTERALVDVVPPDFGDPGWIAVLEAEGLGGQPVLLVHADDDRLRDLAVLDVVINNADRKGGHLLPEAGAPYPQLPTGSAASVRRQPEREVNQEPTRRETRALGDVSAEGGDEAPEQRWRLWACDHGVSFHTDPKLRTVLWGWAGAPLRLRDTETLRRLMAAFDGALGEELSAVLNARELAALRRRASGLVAAGSMPVPAGSWPAVPWPAF